MLKIDENKEITPVYLKDNTYTGASLIQEPFGNCQNFSIKYFVNIYSCLQLHCSKKKLKFSQELLNSLIDLSVIIDKFILVVDLESDIAESFLEDIKTVNKKDDEVELLGHSIYNSTNGSEMHILIVKLRNNNEYNGNDDFDDDYYDDDYIRN